MKTEELITRLAREASPVRPLASPAARGGAWLAASLAAVVVAAAVTSATMAPGLPNLGTSFLVEHALALMAGAALALAAFSSVVPGEGRRFGRLAAVLGIAWVAAVGWDVVRDVRATGTFGVAGETDWSCVALMLTVGGMMWALMVPRLRQGVPMTPRLTMMLAGAASLSMADIVACAARSHASPSVLLVWHGLTFIAVAAALGLAGRRLFPWPVRST